MVYIDLIQKEMREEIPMDMFTEMKEFTNYYTTHEILERFISPCFMGRIYC